jgi:hypothetical protein
VSVVGEPESQLSKSEGQPLHTGSTGINPNQFVEAGLLRGVCKSTLPSIYPSFSQTILALGFTPPLISASSTVMSGPIPNVITLPFGKAPPFHIKATTWRHLLKLMARLSGTRIEPTVEAVAEAKEDLRLRTVIQFTKVGRLQRRFRPTETPSCPAGSSFLDGMAYHHLVDDRSSGSTFNK